MLDAPQPFPRAGAVEVPASAACYATADVARLLRLTPAQVRGHARGLLHPTRGPRNAYRFSFQDLVLLRTAAALAAAKVPAPRIRRALRTLARQLPAGRQLSGVRVLADGREVIVQAEGRTWRPESGQLVLDLEVKQLAAQAAPIARRHVRTVRAAEQTVTADEWFALALDLEAVDHAGALDGYRRALALEPKHADAHVNLGRLLQEGKQLPEAAQHYREALRLAPEHVTAAYNLGTVLEDLGDRTGAVAAYQQALSLDPRLADAHYNLSRLYEQVGQGQAALRHLKAYRTLIRRK